MKLGIHVRIIRKKSHYKDCRIASVTAKRSKKLSPEVGIGMIE